MSTKEWREKNIIKMREYRREYYHRNKKSEKDRIVFRKEKIIEWFKEYKSTLTCKVCPENHPSCLDFHHIIPTDKQITISKAVRDGWSIDSILDEIDKCDVLCSNCHRKLHWVDNVSS